jgi:hypothetical protein
MKHLSEEDLVLIYYGEPQVPESARRHLAECAHCKSEADSLAQTLDLCNEWSVPARPPAFERSVWAQLAPQLEQDSRSRWIFPRLWLAAAATLVLLIGAFLLGRGSRTAAPSIMTGLSNQARERILEISLADHLDRVGILLTEVSNTADSRNFAPERARAEDLLEEDRLMRQMVAHQGQSATTAFLDEVERVMLEIANAPDGVTPREVRALQERIGSGSLLFKVRIIESNLRTQGQKL